MASGIIVIDKPAGWTSMDVCAKLRRVFGERRVGHSGTLDPMATGVLPVFVGRATRAVEFADKSDKEYIAGLKLGVVTNTQDTSGEVLERHDLGGVGRQDVDRVLEQFWGDILQIPPMYSAIKIQGKRLYELARKGCEVERPPRPVTIHSLELEEREERASPADFLLRVRCSKGTYIRTLCHDIGQALGCGGCMSSLRRTMAAGFTLKDAVPLEEVLAAEEPQRLLMPVDAYFRDRPALTVPLSGEKPLRNGAKIPMPGLAPGEYRVYAQSGEFLALGREETGQLATVKSFFEV